jgi:alkylation response protein AidB-like acyl-CoA dehydrogenase
MDFSLSEDQRMMVEAARRLVDRHILKIMEKAAELGLTSARIPESGGGAGLSMLDYGLITEQMPPSVVLIVQPHEATTARVYFGCNEEQKARFLEDLMSGRRIACTASTEPDVGSDPRGVKTTLTEEGEHLVLKGRKQWISNSTVCDLMNVTCRKLNPDGTSSLARVIVERAESPFEAREVLMHGLRQAPLGEVLFDGCRVPKRNLCP